mgnify:CR=1 FL=1
MKNQLNQNKNKLIAIILSGLVIFAGMGITLYLTVFIEGKPEPDAVYNISGANLDFEAIDSYPQSILQNRRSNHYRK